MCTSVDVKKGLRVMLWKTLLGFLIFLLFVACSETSKLKRRALEDAREQYLVELKNEVMIPFDTKLDLRKRFLRTMDRKTEFEVQDLKVEKDEATVVIKAIMVPNVVKTELISLIANYHGGNEISLNVEDVLVLITQQLKLPLDQKESKLMNLRYENRDGWKLKGK